MSENTDPLTRSDAEPWTRRKILTLGALAGLGALTGAGGAGARSSRRPTAASAAHLAAAPIPEVRVGCVGLGPAGQARVENLLAIPGCRIAAICDIAAEKVARAQDRVGAAGFPRPKAFARGPRDFERLCAEEELDLVVDATPSVWRAFVCRAALEHGKHVSAEAPLALTPEDCWRLVETAERERLHCVMLAASCYGAREMRVLRMVRQGLLGELIYGEAGDFPAALGLGPIAQRMGLNRGDRCETLVSMNAVARGRRRSSAASQDDASLVRTARGRTIYIAHGRQADVTQGTRGIVSIDPDRVYIEGLSPAHEWERLEKYGGWEHPLWKNRAVEGEALRRASYLQDLRLIECLRAGTPTEIDVYDAADWSAVASLCERAADRAERAIELPDFTRGAWRSRVPLGTGSLSV